MSKKDLFNDSTMTFGEHLEVLRVHLWKAIVGLVIGSIVAFYFSLDVIIAIQTPINKQAWGTPEALKDLLTLIPYQRIGQPEDIGNVAVWLCSDDSDYINGTSIFVDGGMTLYPGFTTNG